jgi:hypothetical protein
MTGGSHLSARERKNMCTGSEGIDGPQALFSVLGRFGPPGSVFIYIFDFFSPFLFSNFRFVS